MSDLDDMLALDLARLRAPDGGPLDPAAHRAALEGSWERSVRVLIRREGALRAYGSFWMAAPGEAFVGGLMLAEGAGGLARELGRRLLAALQEAGAERVVSHVRKGNAESLRLHRRLGFIVERESAVAVAFALPMGALAARLG
ncbi:N-acetyltransferase family protein [Pseudoroseicyclus sp. CXY001]|uniref:GNAT family N-acetyltransferase n=1 Tax=Pseudoroseicyclus sp. CXY001 TaxID=3242492 RepID=UPI0035714164